MSKRYRVGDDPRQLDCMTGVEADQLTSPITADLCRPLIAIALYAVGFASLMLVLNPLHLAEGSEWLLWLQHLARGVVETVSEFLRPIANALS
jgi:hypothetical protein